ncbi:MAG: aminopeptidase [Victivallaceae bacterium]|nr:aminopeptidase [Victivallaceae bacterium]
MDSKRLSAYAELIVTNGLNPDKGQAVFVIANLDQPEFVRMVVESCYRHGAGKVVVQWEDMPLTRLAHLYRSEESLSEVESWEIAKLQWRVDQLPALLWLESDDPDGMYGVDPGKRARAQMARFPVIKPYRDAMENKHQWCIAAVPGAKWARKVFPGMSAAAAQKKLWDAILTSSRADGDPIANWKAHNQRIHQRCAKLNAYHFSALAYQSSNGTSFRVGLMREGIFAGASETDLSGRTFNPNIPSEEIFTTPKRGSAEGILVATKPLSWQGAMIEDFRIRFQGGRAVEVQAKKGQEVLERMIAMDEGASFLGECALIEYDSPINNTGILFYNTLFDENASCHFALGRGFDNCVQDYEKFSQEQLHSFGVNDSMIHVDFMVGSRDMAITGIAEDGTETGIFRNGSWCF